MSVPLSVPMDDELHARLQAAAEREDRPAPQVAALAIAAWLDGQDEMARAIDAAVEQADRGRFVSREAVAAWMDGWGTAAEPPPEPDIEPADGS